VTSIYSLAKLCLF